MYDPNRLDTTKRAYKMLDNEKAAGASARVQGKTPSPVTNTPATIKTVADLYENVKQYDKGFLLRMKSVLCS